MPKREEGISKAERILMIYQMLRSYEEVSMQELRNRFRDYSDKTFSRDISLLKLTGVPVHFSMRRKAFVLLNELGEESHRSTYRGTPEFPTGKKEKQFLDKIIRFIIIIDEIPDEYCDIWYKEAFPNVSQRTMQRDFALLGRLGFWIRYARIQGDCPFCWNNDTFEPHYYCKYEMY